MNYNYLLVWVLSILVISKLLKNKKKQQNLNLPPSPPSLPIIGHLHLLRHPVHRQLQNLSHKYGPIISLRFGSRPVIVVSSPSAIEECFTKNDVALAGRPPLLISKHLHYNNTTIATASHGPLWRNIRRVATFSMFSNTQLNAYIDIRRDEVHSLVKGLTKDVCAGQPTFTKVQLRSRLEDLTFNVVLRIVAGKRYFGEGADQDVREAKHFKEMISKIFEISGASTPEDFLPVLRWTNIRGTEKKILKLKHESDRFSQHLIDEHRNKASDEHNHQGKPKTVIDTMLSMQESEPQYYTDEIIKGMIMILLTAGTDTSSATIEWCMTLLLNHPKVLAKARAEIDQHIGRDRIVDESDLPKLRFIQYIVNEALRLFPVAPLLVPHVAMDDCKIGGYDVQRGTMLLVNAWALHKDPEVWEDPTSFKPERFEGGVGGTEGYKFVPFGTGRRQCPGASLANRVIGWAVASLVQCFDWERVGEELLDVSEGKGLTMPTLIPFEAMCRAREEMTQLLSLL